MVAIDVVSKTAAAAVVVVVSAVVAYIFVQMLLQLPLANLADRNDFVVNVGVFALLQHRDVLETLVAIHTS